MTPKLAIGDEISAGITVRGFSVNEHTASAQGGSRLDAWMSAQEARLPDGAKFEASDAFSSKPQGEYRLLRTLKVIEDENPV